MPWDHGKYREGTAYRKNVNHTKKERSPKDLGRGFHDPIVCRDHGRVEQLPQVVLAKQVIQIGREVAEQGHPVAGRLPLADAFNQRLVELIPSPKIAP